MGIPNFQSPGGVARQTSALGDAGVTWAAISYLSAGKTVENEMAERVCHNLDSIMDAFKTGPKENVMVEVNSCVLSELRGLPLAETFKRQEDMFSEIIQGIAKLHAPACTATREIWDDPKNRTPYLDITCGTPVNPKDLTS